MTKRFNIDYSRKERLGFDEVIFGASKSVDVLIELLNDYVEKGENVLITKLQPEKATELLMTHVQDNIQGFIYSLVKVDLTQNEFDALVSLIYNIGSGNFKSSTLLRILNQKKYDAAANQFLRWNKAGGRVLAGLTKRREHERELFLT